MSTDRTLLAVWSGGGNPQTRWLVTGQRRLLEAGVRATKPRGKWQMGIRAEASFPAIPPQATQTSSHRKIGASSPTVKYCLSFPRGLRAFSLNIYIWNGAKAKSRVFGNSKRLSVLPTRAFLVLGSVSWVTSVSKRKTVQMQVITGSFLCHPTTKYFRKVSIRCL